MRLATVGLIYTRWLDMQPIVFKDNCCRMAARYVAGVPDPCVEDFDSRAILPT